MQGRGSYDGDNPPVFILADRGTGQRYVIPVIAVDESTIGLLLSNYTPASVIIYTDGFRTHEQLNEDNAFNREYVVYAEGDTLTKTFTPTPARVTWNLQKTS